MDLHISLAAREGRSSAIYRQVRDAVMRGTLRGGDSLPSSRALAARLQVSRNTVVEAYQRLRAEGFLETRTGAGTFVRDGLGTRFPSGPAASPLRPRAGWEQIPEGRDLSIASPRFDFRPGMPDARLFPFPAWRARLARQIRPARVGKGAYIGAAGHPDLRMAIARHVSLSRGVRATADDVFVTNGCQQALDLLIRVLLVPGDMVAVEDPGYPLAHRSFLSHGSRVRGVPVDDEGLVVDAIPEGCRLVHVTPSHQYPLGVAMSMDRRKALIEWAERADGVVVEDDYDSEFRFGGRALEPLQSLDPTGRVIYLGSFSKVMLPTLRLGFAILPAPLHSAFRKARYLADWHTEVPLQVAAAEFLDDGLLGRHIRRMQRIYSRRHDRILEVLHRDFERRLEPIPSHGGLHVTARLLNADACDDARVAEQAEALGVGIVPLSRHFRDHPPEPGLLFGYGAISTDMIEEGLALLARSL